MAQDVTYITDMCEHRVHSDKAYSGPNNCLRQVMLDVQA